MLCGDRPNTSSSTICGIMINCLLRRGNTAKFCARHVGERQRSALVKLWTKTRALPSQLTMLNMPTASAAGEVTAQHVVAREEAIDRWFGGGGSSNPAIEAEVDTIRRQLLAEEEERVRRRARQTECEAWVRVRRGELSGGERSAAASAARLRGARLQVEADIARAVAQMLPHAAARQLV